MTKLTTLVAVHEVHYTEAGKQKVASPGAVFNVDKAEDADFLLERGAATEPTPDQLLLEKAKRGVSTEDADKAAADKAAADKAAADKAAADKAAADKAAADKADKKGDEKKDGAKDDVIG